MPSEKQKREADSAKKKVLAEKQKAAKEKLRKERETAKEKAATLAKEAKERKESAKAAVAARKKEALRQQAAEVKRQQEKRGTVNKTQSLPKAVASPRLRASKRDSASTTSSVTSAATQGEHNRVKITNPPTLKKNLGKEFERAIGLDGQREGELSVGSVKKVAYTPNDLERNDDTGRSIIEDAAFVTDLVDFDPSKVTLTPNPQILLQKVQDNIGRCRSTPDDPDAIRFLTIIENFKVSNYGRIFGETGVPSKAEHPKFLGVKLLYRSTLAI